jgi:hypothetical protein
MNYTFGIACGLLAIMVLGGFLYFRRKRIERLNRIYVEIPNFLRGENAENNPDIDSEVHTIRIHPWGKAE